MSVQVRLLGRPRVSVGGRGFEPPADRRSALLCYLAHAGGRVSRDDLLYLFWPDSEERKGRANLRQLLMVVRDAPFAVGLEVERARVRWPVATDLADWQDERRPVRRRPSWPGGLLEGFRLAGAPEFESWLEIERAAWGERFRAAILSPVATEDGSADAEDEDAHGAALEAWLQVEPLDEEALRAWMVIAGRRGRRTAALGRFAAFEAQLRSELGLTPEPATRALVERLRRPAPDEPVRGDRPRPAGPHAPPPAPAFARHAPSRAPGASPFVGRRTELDRLARDLLVDGGPVVTVLGSGGMGKTRLALEAAERLAPCFADGLVVVPLAAATRVDEVAPAVAAALGLPPDRRRAATEEVAEALRGRTALVVLDNLEQLPGAAALIDRWREAAPACAWLLTSRVVVGVRGESILELGGLPPPGPDGAAADDPAIELLRSGARRAGRDLDLARDGTDLARLVRLTGGMPLALELAAGWLRVLPLHAIADELAAGLAPLSSVDGGGDPRHASMQAVFDAAWTALSTAERAALARLAPFRGGFDERAAREAADVGRPLLLALRNRSMLTLGASGRFGWHPLLEVYLRDRAMADAAAFARAAERHARYFLDLLARCEDEGQAGAARESLAVLQREHPNLEAAWATALARGWWRPLVKGGAMLGMSYEAAGRGARWGELLREALGRVPRGSLVWAVLEINEAAIDAFARRHERAYDRRRAAVEVLRQQAEGEPFFLGWGLLLLGQSAWATDRPAEARATARAAAEAFERAADRGLAILARSDLLAFTTDPDERERAYEEFRRASSAEVASHTVTSVEADQAAYLAAVHGEHGRAVAMLDRALAREEANPWFESNLAELRLAAAELKAQSGDAAAAVVWIDGYLAAWRPSWISSPLGRGEALALRALIAMERGEAGAEELLRPDGEAARTHRGLLLRAELASRRGAFEEARGLVEEARARIGEERVGWDRAVWLVRAALAAAEVSLAAARVAQTAGDDARSHAARTLAAGEIGQAIDHALGGHLLPALLHALAVALPLLPHDLAAEVAAFAAGHPAATIGVRRRLAGVAPGLGAGEARAEDRSARWEEARVVARRVAGALRIEVATARDG